MAEFALIYGLRIVPSPQLKSTQAGSVILKQGDTREITLHVIEGSKEQIRAQLLRSIDAFFDVFDDMTG